MAYAKWTPAEDAKLISMLAQGYKVREVAEELSRPAQQVHSHMHYRGLSKAKIRKTVERARAEAYEDAEAARLSVSEHALAKYLPEIE